jgi:predicted site-specific integrase-resolvase
MKTKPKQWLTVKEAAELAGIRYPTYHRWIMIGKVKTKDRKSGRYTMRRISLTEAERIKRIVDSGMWV